MKRKALISLGLFVLCLGAHLGLASASVFYQTEQAGECKTSDIKLNTPYTSGGGELWCVGKVDANEVTPAQNGGCVPGSPTYSFNGTFCFKDLSQATALTDSNSQSVPTDCQPDGGAQLDASNCKIYDYLLTFINALSALVVVVVIIAIVMSGIQYSASQNDPNATANAKKHIAAALLALVAYIFMYSFLQWIIPGGLF